MLKKISLFITALFCTLFSSGQDSTKTEKNPSNSEEFFFNISVNEIKNNHWSHLDSTIATLNAAISYYQLKNKNCQLFNAQAVKGRVFFNAGMPDSATSAFIKASILNQKDCPELDEYYFYNSWAILYLEMGDFELGDSISMLALAATRQMSDKKYKLNVMTNRALLFAKNESIDTAISITQNIFSEALVINNQYHIWSSLLNLGHFYLQQNNNDSALFYLNQMSALVSDEMPDYLKMNLYNNLAVVYSEKGELKKGADFYLKAINLAKTNKKLNSLLIYLDNYARALKRLGQSEQAYLYLKEYIILKDSLQSAEKVQYIKTLEKEYETGKQREKILVLEREDLKKDLELKIADRDKYIGIAILIGILIFSIGLYTRLRFVRKSKHIIEKEKKRSDDLLLNILPAQVADELKQTGESEARQYNDVSVLFTDFVQFTQFTEKLTAKELVEEIGDYFKSFDNICSKFNVEKIKTIGDAYMAAAGVPASDSEAAENAIRASLEMQSFMITRYKENVAKGKPALRMRSGIHSGPVVAGIVGVKKFQYDIWGDTVNTAARMESSGEAEKVNISVTTYEYVKHIADFNFSPRGKIEVKGKGDIEMFYVSLK